MSPHTLFTVFLHFLGVLSDALTRLPSPITHDPAIASSHKSTPLPAKWPLQTPPPSTKPALRSSSSSPLSPSSQKFPPLPIPNSSIARPPGPPLNTPMSLRQCHNSTTAANKNEIATLAVKPCRCGIAPRSGFVNHSGTLGIVNMWMAWLFLIAAK